MYAWEMIQKEILKINTNGMQYLTNIEKLPHEHALQIAAYLWECCCTTDNDFWYTIARGLLWNIPLHWTQHYTTQILQIMDVNWQDDFEYNNACVVFAHQPEILQILIDWGKQNGMTEDATEWEKIGCQTKYFTQTMAEFERLCDVYQIRLSFGCKK